MAFAGIAFAHLSAGVGGSVVLFRPPGSEPPRDHEAATQGAVARLLAEVKGCEFAGTWDGACGYAGRLFFVPADTLLTDEAARLGIASPDDLFGGVVPYRFVKTKAISHGLPGPRAARPPGWSDAFTAEVAPAVLPGFTAFTRGDARAAACRLLEDGAIRIKPPLAAGSRGQRVAPTLDDVDEALAVLTESDLADCGVVLEANLADVSTLSVGKVTVDRLTVSYVGTQAETPDNEGRHVYGGSDLTVIRGGWEALDRLDVEPIARQAIAQAIAYDGATVEFPGFLASRRNYDVALGVEGRGRRRVGVLEASWRVRVNPVPRGGGVLMNAVGHTHGLCAAQEELGCSSLRWWSSASCSWGAAVTALERGSGHPPTSAASSTIWWAARSSRAPRSWSFRRRRRRGRRRSAARRRPDPTYGRASRAGRSGSSPPVHPTTRRIVSS